MTPLGDILLTGATGFLGIHVLRKFLENHSGKVYCLMRAKDDIAGDVRLRTRLVQYFGHDYRELLGKRLFTIEGDLVAFKSVNVTVNTVINCAANVKHFAVGDELQKVNSGGVKNLIRYCLDHQAMLIQISTAGVAGTGAVALKELKLKESQLYLGQALDNQYIHSKFLAERSVLTAVCQGLKAKIMRVGNLMPRHTDGAFQINLQGNSFMNRLKTFKLLEKCPVTLMDAMVEFSPIDSMAKAILKLSETNSEYTVFHPYNNHPVYLSNIIDAMQEYGFAIDIVGEPEFKKSLKEKMENERLMAAATGILAYRENKREKSIDRLGITNEFTTEILYRLNFKWPPTADDYLKKVIATLDGLGFFDA
jgi:thioester reductase-like protein